MNEIYCIHCGQKNEIPPMSINLYEVPHCIKCGVGVVTVIELLIGVGIINEDYVPCPSCNCPIHIENFCYKCGWQFNREEVSKLQMLSFCTRCGNKVKPYEPSKVYFGDCDFDSTSEIDAQPHYWCSACHEHWMAMNLLDTGTWCENCNMHLPINKVKFCGRCGMKYTPKKLDFFPR